MYDLFVVRAVFVLLLSVCAFFLTPFRLSPPVSAVFGLALGLVAVALEMRVKQLSLKRLIGCAVGSVLGIFGAFLVSLVLQSSLSGQESTASFLQLATLLVMGYGGLAIGWTKGDMLNLAAFGNLFGSEATSKTAFKILDTSVIIDGRISDIVETGFLDGVLVIPQFVLRELQQVADSADSLKRNRGRRGLDILQTIQKTADIQVRIVEDDFPNVREVDLKLIELAKLYACTIVTNDFNLNKVAQLHGVEVLNINELANALKPVVLPGEVMRVFILKEGKEHNQGVAYLDDGTMVVVDNARKQISKTVDIIVTSVLQTTAGKMIFGRFDERSQGPPSERTREREQPAGAA